MHTLEAQTELNEFYAGSGSLYIPEHYRDGTHSVVKQEAEIVLPDYYDTLDENEIKRRREEINDTYKRIQAGAYCFEIAIVNKAAATNTPYESFGSTLGSALSTNVLNAEELARRGAAQSDLPQVYVAFFGNGQSTPIHDKRPNQKDAEEFRRTGRMTTEDKNGEPRGIYPIQCLAEALLSHDINIDVVTGDSAGGVMMMALGVELAYRKKQVRAGVINNRPQLFDTEMRDMLTIPHKDRRDGEKFKDNKTPDKWSVAPYTKNDQNNLKKTFPRIHSPETQREVRKISGGLAGTIGKLALGAQGFGRGPKNGDPLLHDTQAFMATNPEATLTLVFPSQDYLNKTPEENEARIEYLLNKIDMPDGARISALEPHTTHNYDKYYPGIRAAQKEYAIKKR